MDLNNKEISALVGMSRDFAGGEDGLREIVEEPGALNELIEATFYYYARDKNWAEGTTISVQDILGNKDALSQAIIESLDQ